jgi:general secretion pathway protein G
MQRETGFTLIELMLVIIILGILSATIIPQFTGRSEQARIVAARSDIESGISIALDLFEVDNGFYPTTTQGLGALLKKPSVAPSPPNWNGPYIKKKPVDPWGSPYAYVCPGMHNTESYDLSSYGRDGVEGGGDDICNWETEKE